MACLGTLLSVSSRSVSNMNKYLREDIPSPCYVLDEALLRNNLELMKRVQVESGASIILALKDCKCLIRNYL